MKLITFNTNFAAEDYNLERMHLWAQILQSIMFEGFSMNHMPSNITYEVVCMNEYTHIFLCILFDIQELDY